MFTFGIGAVVGLIIGAICGYLLRRNSPETSKKIEQAYQKGRDEVISEIKKRANS